jgi:hypothetical protein
MHTMDGVSERPEGGRDSRDRDIAAKKNLEEGEGSICISTGTYTVRVNLYAGELGK